MGARSTGQPRDRLPFIENSRPTNGEDTTPAHTAVQLVAFQLIPVWLQRIRMRSPHSP